MCVEAMAQDNDDPQQPQQHDEKRFGGALSLSSSAAVPCAGVEWHALNE